MFLMPPLRSDFSRHGWQIPTSAYCCKDKMLLDKTIFYRITIHLYSYLCISKETDIYTQSERGERRKWRHQEKIHINYHTLQISSLSHWGDSKVESQERTPGLPQGGQGLDNLNCVTGSALAELESGARGPKQCIPTYDTGVLTGRLNVYPWNDLILFFSDRTRNLKLLVSSTLFFFTSNRPQNVSINVLSLH